LVFQISDLNFSGFDGTTARLGSREVVAKFLGEVFVDTNVVFAEKY
jgi:hypothetical protein